jgi:hypothetical protein
MCLGTLETATAQTCNSIQCTGASDTHRLIATAATLLCTGGVCTEAQCCETKATCGNLDGVSGLTVTDADCGANYAAGSTRSNNICAGSSCDVGSPTSTDQAYVIFNIPT